MKAFILLIATLQGLSSGHRFSSYDDQYNKRGITKYSFTQLKSHTIQQEVHDAWILIENEKEDEKEEKDANVGSKEEDSDEEKKKKKKDDESEDGEKKKKKDDETEDGEKKKKKDDETEDEEKKDSKKDKKKGKKIKKKEGIESLKMKDSTDEDVKKKYLDKLLDKMPMDEPGLEDIIDQSKIGEKKNQTEHKGANETAESSESSEGKKETDKEGKEGKKDAAESEGKEDKESKKETDTEGKSEKKKEKSKEESKEESFMQWRVEPPQKNAGTTEQPTIQEEDAKAKELADAHQETKKLDAQKQQEEIWRNLKPDGTLHVNGLRHFPDGAIVGGVNLI